MAKLPTIYVVFEKWSDGYELHSSEAVAWFFNQDEAEAYIAGREDRRGWCEVEAVPGPPTEESDQ